MPALFSRSCEYGLQAVLYLAKENDSRPISLREIATTLNLPHTFLSKILQKLSRAGILKSQKGNQGGFTLAKPASQIMLGDIVTGVDGIEFLDTCVTGFAICSDLNPCPLHAYWKEMRSIISHMLEKENIADLSERIDVKIASLGPASRQKRLLKSA